MSRLAIACLVAFACCGCASRKSAPPASTAPAAPLTTAEAVEAAEPTLPDTASALAFAFPAEARIDAGALAREHRERSAFLGFDEGTAEYYAVRMDDRQRTNGYGSNNDRYERRAVSVKVGVRYR